MSVQNRSDFNYSKAQTIKNNPGVNPNLFFPSLDGWTRKFDLTNQSYMFDLFLNRAGKASPYVYTFNGISLIPYVGGSVGLSVINVKNFHTATNSRDSVGGFVFDRSRVIMPDKHFNKFAWQLQIGTDVAVTDYVLLGIGYRYYDGGRFESNDHTIDLLRPTGGNERTYLYKVDPWKAKLRSSELVFSLSVLI